MKKNILFALSVILGMMIAIPAFTQELNKLSAKEKKEGWVLLFNGKNFDGWRKCSGTEMPKNWTIEQGAMKVTAAEGNTAGQPAGGDILYSVKKFKNFEVSVDWNAGKMGNSGLFYDVREVPGQPIFYAAPEVQLLDNENASDNKVASHLAGSLYDMIACDPKTVKPSGSWNTLVVRVKDGNVTHFMNGVKVVSYTLWTPEWDAMVAKSKFKSFPGFTEGISKEGYIGLQDHGYSFMFRNIKIREL